MPDLTFSSAFRVADLQTVITTAIAGFVIGWLVLATLPTTLSENGRAVTIGTLLLSFLVPIGVSRYMTGTPLWPGWIGTCALAVLFTLTLSLGSRLRKRRG